MTSRELDSQLKKALAQEFGLPVVKETHVDMETGKDFDIYVLVTHDKTLDELLALERRVTEFRVSYEAPIRFLGKRVLIWAEAR